MLEKEPIQTEILLEPDTLWERVKEQTEYALRCGALVTIPTEFELIEQGGVQFLVRVLSNLARKDRDMQKQEQKTATGKNFNPFLPYEEDLFVADISATHVCLLNKYNVADYHLLIITRGFEEQESLLTQQDFAAMCACLAEFDGLVFYNGGKIAGASQRHKHLQLVPLPLTPNGLQIPIEPLLKSAQFQDCITTIPQFPFVHAFTRLNLQKEESPITAAEATLKRYQTLLRAVGLEDVANGNTHRGYNLLATRQWMLIVPRSQESFESIAVNSLGFAGTLFVRNEQQMQILKNQGPITVLEKVAFPIKFA